MKKFIALTVCIATLASYAALGTSYASASFGTAADVIASDVKMIKTGLYGKKLCFTDGDFKSALCLSDFKSITVTKIPSSTEGTLLLSGRRVGEGKTIKRKALGALVFIPASSSVDECSFSFTVDGYAGGAEIECILKFTDKVNYAPKTVEDGASTETLKTQESISVFARLDAIDPEGDSLEYIIVSYPKHGRLNLLDSSTGNFSYTPEENYVGTDKFTYTVRDEYGNYAEPTQVKLKVSERMCDTEYVDMVDREEYNAAVAMTAIGVMNGKMLGDDYYFSPDEKVTRAEFVALAMKSAGIRADSTLTSTYFDDDSEISPSLKGYIATAQKLGFINGDFKDGQLLFSPNGEITKYEAAKILASIIGSNDDGEESVFSEDNGIPVWARAGVYVMCSLGIFSEADSATLTDTLTRANTASYLYKMIEKT